MATLVHSDHMPRMVDIDDLIDANDVADLIGVTHRNTVSQYQQRYPDMPRPVIDLGAGRCKMWLRSEITAWARSSGRLP
jgi:glutathione-regulated potassium-efflux system ancillary protein KefG